MAKASKKFRLQKEQLKPLAPGHGGCVATDMITVHGQPVGYMYREKPCDRSDSGWAFFSGQESDDYANDPANLEICDVNTIANYDPSIIPYLDAPPGSSFEKSNDQSVFVTVTEGEPTPLEYPTVKGLYKMTRDWTLTLPDSFKRRIEDDALVLWRPGITLWIISWANDGNETREQRLSRLQAESSKDAYSQEVLQDGDITRYVYHLNEDHDGATVHALYAFVIADFGHIQMAIYLDNDSELEAARTIWKSFEFSSQRSGTAS